MYVSVVFTDFCHNPVVTVVGIHLNIMFNIVILVFLDISENRINLIFLVYCNNIKEPQFY